MALQGILEILPFGRSRRVFTFPFDPDETLAKADNILRKKENKNGQKQGFQETVAD